MYGLGFRSLAAAHLHVYSPRMEGQVSMIVCLPGGKSSQCDVAILKDTLALTNYSVLLERHINFKLNESGPFSCWTALQVGHRADTLDLRGPSYHNVQLVILHYENAGPTSSPWLSTLL